MSELDEYMHEKTQEVAHDYRERSSNWRADYVEFLVWEHFCKFDVDHENVSQPVGDSGDASAPARAIFANTEFIKVPGELFPGNEVKPERKRVKVEDVDNDAGPSRLDLIFSDGMDSVTRVVKDKEPETEKAWIHDKYSYILSPTKHVHVPSRSESVRLPDYYKPAWSVLRSDYYRPTRDGGSRASTRDSEHLNASRTVGHSPQASPSKAIPTGPAASRQDQHRSKDEKLREMARSYGIHTQRYDTVQKLCREEVNAKHSNKVLSADLLKWKEQSMIWRQFCRFRFRPDVRPILTLYSLSEAVSFRGAELVS
jgi:hypothetical protein